MDVRDVDADTAKVGLIASVRLSDRAITNVHEVNEQMQGLRDRKTSESNPLDDVVVDHL